MTIVEPGYFRTDFLDASSLETEANIIDDHAETSGATRDARRRCEPRSAGRPGEGRRGDRRSGVIAGAPLRIQLGRDAFAGVAQKLESVAQEQQAWRDVAVSTDHDDVAAAAQD
ncbi:hypothetical protein [Mycobacterium sp. 2YAF39]|uniref:hypothetical protein n=1 Tax=Mycobacterium sp. 2YAF39 TaxID=3233033 RepID=UPI003F9B6FF4